ncbi:MAG: XdhC/CoxI family protein [Acidimicrobiales bacterium]|nr:XdhC/CoxI family protein [Acidimicrobiales bacterium]
MNGKPKKDISIFDHMERLLEKEESFALVTVVKGSPVGKKMIVFPDEKGGDGFEGSLGNRSLDRVVSRDARGELAAGRSGVRNYGESGEAREETIQVFVESFIKPPQLLIVGAVDFTAALVKIGKVLGFRVIVCDAREVFATTQRFPLADEVIVEWPNKVIEELGQTLGPRDAVCILTHDAKFDVPAIVSALTTEVGYIGVMGSRKTHEDRTNRLNEVGVTVKEIERLRSPIGLDIGSRTPEETAISIVAEIIALRTGRSSTSLSETHGPIHD